MTMTPASRLLDLARAANPDGPTGVARSGACVVTFLRAHRAGFVRARYDVGTDAVSIADGPRARVLPYVEAILAGCVTREACDAWIADAPARVAAAKASGARMPDGTVTA